MNILHVLRCYAISYILDEKPTNLLPGDCILSPFQDIFAIDSPSWTLRDEMRRNIKRTESSDHQIDDDWRPITKIPSSFTMFIAKIHYLSTVFALHRNKIKIEEKQPQIYLKRTYSFLWENEKIQNQSKWKLKIYTHVNRGAFIVLCVHIIYLCIFDSESKKKNGKNNRK